MRRVSTVVLTAAVAWTGTHARPQHVALGLARRGWDVLFVDGPVTWIGPLKNPDLRARAIPKDPLRDVPVDGSGRLRVLSPMASAPFGNLYRPVNRINQWLLAEQIRRAAPGPYVLLPMLPGSVDLLPHLHPLATVYDCVDLHAEFQGFVHPALVTRMEQDLVAVSRVVFATADALRERLLAWHNDVRLVPNAAEVEHFAKTSELPEHPLLAPIQKPRVGYVGGIGSWVDQQLIFQLAVSRPTVQWVMIGPVETDVSRLRGLPNVHFLGLQPYAQLPRFLAGFDAALHAFVQNDLTQSVNPIKIYEYLAAGREVIATTSRELSRMDRLLWLVRNADDALAALDAILAGAHRCSDADRQAFVAAHSWDARVSEIDRVLRAIVPAELRPPRV
ncbi:MAG: glycosyltransferase [Alicyclobacillus sp.]|nr:glycosyltransferase [Alicyclobacillus sp.]